MRIFYAYRNQKYHDTVNMTPFFKLIKTNLGIKFRWQARPDAVFQVSTNSSLAQLGVLVLIVDWLSW